MKRNILGRLILVIIVICFITLYFVRFTDNKEQEVVENYKTAVEVEKVQLGNIDKLGQTLMDSLIISKDALIRELDGNYVFSIEDNVATKVAVTIGVEGDDNVQITSGLQKDDEVIVKGKEFIKDGEEVQVGGGSN